MAVPACDPETEQCRAVQSNAEQCRANVAFTVHVAAALDMVWFISVREAASLSTRRAPTNLTNPNLRLRSATRNGEPSHRQASVQPCKTKLENENLENVACFLQR